MRKNDLSSKARLSLHSKCSEEYSLACLLQLPPLWSGLGKCLAHTTDKQMFVSISDIKPTNVCVCVRQIFASDKGCEAVSESDKCFLY